MSDEDQVPLQKRRRKPSPPLTDRLPPHNNECEMSILACIIADDKATVMPLCTTRFRAKGAEFYDLRHQQIYAICLELFEDNDPIDVVSVVTRLKAYGKLEDVGGTMYVSSLPDRVSSTANAEYYIEEVLECYKLRRAIQICTATINTAYEPNGKKAQFLDEFESSVFNLRVELEPAGHFTDIPSTLDRLQVKYENAIAGAPFPGIKTGFNDVDYIIGGMEKQDMILVSGEPSAGKTSFALNICAHCAKSGIKSGFISLETSSEKILHRINCIFGKAEGGAVLRGYGTQKDIDNLQTGMVKTMNFRDNLILHDGGGLNYSEIEGIARRMVQQGATFVVIDYLQLIASNAKSSYERATQTSKFIKMLAKKLNCPVIAIASLNRIAQPQASTKKNDAPVGKKPTMFNLRDSGQLEYDGDKILILYRKNVEGSEAANKEAENCREIVVDVNKSKDGGTGKAYLHFFQREFRMESVAKISDAAVQDSMAPSSTDTPPQIQPEISFSGESMPPAPED